MISTRQIFGLAKHAPGGPLDVDDLREMAASISGNASISALTDDQRLELCQRLDKKFVPRPVQVSKPSQRRKSRLPAELFAAADKIYRMDTVKYARIAAWIMPRKRNSESGMRMSSMRFSVSSGIRAKKVGGRT